MGKRGEMYNASGCRDLTAFQALNNIESEERFKEFKKAVFSLANRYGYRITNRIEVVDKKTGKKWR